MGALVGGALLFFQEIDTALEVAGLFAAGQFAVRRLLFAEDRKQTANEIKCALFLAPYTALLCPRGSVLCCGPILRQF